MRIFKPTTAAIAAAALALAPAGAYAIRGAGRHAGRRLASSSAGCKLTINAAPRIIENGESALVFGQLTCRSGSVANQTVTVTERPAMGAASTAGTATTDAAGNYQVTSPALSTNTRFSASALGAQSAERMVRVSPKVTLAGPPEGAELFTGAGPILAKHVAAYRNRITFTGTVSPADAGAVVALQREEASGGDGWHRIGLGTVGAGGTFSIVHTFRFPGDASIRVVVGPFKRSTNAINAVGASEPLSYEISQSQNPALTIVSSAEPVTTGQPVTISGTLAGPSGAGLTLWERPRLSRKYVVVGTATSGTAGAYAFAPQTPAQSAFYKVTGAGKTSAVLYEGVRDVLEAKVSASTVQAGQPLTFTGTVSPAEPGHVVYLQIQNPLGIGFHVVEVGTESGTGSFSIVHSPYIAGVKQFRIKVPGDPAYEGAASPVLTVNVTPAPAAALTPELPSNSSLPPEGQL